MPVSTADVLAEWLLDARARTLALAEDLTDEQLLGPRLAIVNPMRWEIGHVAWFQERWVLRHAAGRPPLRADGDALYDSSAIPHDVRWDLPLPDRRGTLAYLQEVLDRVLDRLAEKEPTPKDVYVARLAAFHEDMHDEAFLYTRQTLGYPAPSFVREAPVRAVRDVRPNRGSRAASGGGDAAVPGGTFALGASRRLGADDAFVFDNEKWAHEVEVAPFSIARHATTQGEFADFVDDGGYRRPDLWTGAGRAWLAASGAAHPVHWRREGGAWLRRDFDRWVALEPRRPVLHVNAFEAEAYGRWAGRRLPTEAEWEYAAAGPGPGTSKRRFPWGDAPPDASRANLGAAAGGTTDVRDCPEGDSAFGVRQTIGNVWEWTSSDFLPYPGFVRDPYQEYSEPWFRTHRVLRGGCWVTQPRLLRTTWRNFYTPDRRDVWAGFRTCALGS
jgi:iron(II)-dependent oxidoreductase